MKTSILLMMCLSAALGCRGSRDTNRDSSRVTPKATESRGAPGTAAEQNSGATTGQPGRSDTTDTDHPMGTTGAGATGTPGTTGAPGAGSSGAGGTGTTTPGGSLSNPTPTDTGSGSGSGSNARRRNTQAQPPQQGSADQTQQQTPSATGPTSR